MSHLSCLSCCTLIPIRFFDEALAVQQTKHVKITVSCRAVYSGKICWPRFTQTPCDLPETGENGHEYLCRQSTKKARFGISLPENPYIHLFIRKLWDLRFLFIALVVIPSCLHLFKRGQLSWPAAAANNAQLILAVLE